MTTHDWVDEDRRENFHALQDSGMATYENSSRDDEIASFISSYEQTADDFSSQDEWTLAGRATRINDFGDIYFIDIEDESGSVQLQFDYEQTPNLDPLERINIGDVIEATGVAIRSDTGELTLHSWSVDVLSKSFSHPPARDGLADEERLRQRALALQYDADLQSSVRTRFEIQQTLRQALVREGFLEVETPVLQHVYGGGSATPFETYSEALEDELYLRIAPEIALKKLVIGGFENIFEMSKVFRNEDVDTTHNPEFTMLELYQAYSDYEDMMELTESVVTTVVESVAGEQSIEYNGEMLDFTAPWTRLSMVESVNESVPFDVSTVSEDRLFGYVADVTDDDVSSRSDAIMELYEELVEPTISDPTFVVDYPSGSSPLCKESSDGESQERFEVVVAGMELANAYSEQTNPFAQQDAFAQQQVLNDEGDEAYHEMDMEYIRAMAGGLPPTGGLGIGVDRLAMLLTDSQSIKDVLAFPMVRETSK